MTLDGLVRVTPEALHTMANDIDSHAARSEATIRHAMRILEDLIGQGVFEGASATVLVWRYYNLRMQLFSMPAGLRGYANRLRVSASAIEQADKYGSKSLLMCIAPLVTSDAVYKEIERRLRFLQEIGATPDNSTFRIPGTDIRLPSDQYDARIVISTISNNKQTLRDIAAKYGIPPALLAGTIAAEMDFDHNLVDRIQDGLGRHNLGLGQGVGVASVHDSKLRGAIDYLNSHQTPQSGHASQYNWELTNRASFAGSAEAAAIVLSALYHFRDSQRNQCSVLSPQDMAVVWGGYRTGVDGFSETDLGGYTAQGFAYNLAKPNSNPACPSIGNNAYISLPYFEYFQSQF